MGWQGVKVNQISQSSILEPSYNFVGGVISNFKQIFAFVLILLHILFSKLKEKPLDHHYRHGIPHQFVEI